MKQAYVVIGANFGDEGKGLMTDYFCRKAERPLNVRFNGGAQAGHTVVTSDGMRHVFSHFGAGTLCGADTYLSADFIVNPMVFMKEYAALKQTCGELPQVLIAADAPISLPCDMLLNQFAERSRGDARHGSCGLGIYESVLRSQDPALHISFGEISDTPQARKNIREKIEQMHRVYVPARLAALGVTEIPNELKQLLCNEMLLENYLDDLVAMYRICRTVDDGILESYETAVFEGAQGLLLDCARQEYFPHLTPSHTGMHNVRRILDRLPAAETEICYVTRSYLTRHGAGRFDTETAALAETYRLRDKTNQTNEFQGKFRYGYFDLMTFQHSLALERRNIRTEECVSLCVTHLDETNGQVLCTDSAIDTAELAEAVSVPCVYAASGETAAYVQTKG